MTITNQSRYHLQQRLEEVLGDEEADVLMEHLPPVGWADVATKQDLVHLEASIDLRLEAFGLQLRLEMAEGFARLDRRLLAAYISLVTLMVAMVGVVAVVS